MRSTSLLLPLALLAFACGGEPQPGDDSPRAAATRFAVAVATQDDEAIQAGAIGKDIDREHMSAFLGWCRANRAFHDKFVVAYGEKGWTRFNDTDGAQITFSGAQTREAALEQAANFKIEITGDAAVVTTSGTADKLRLVRADGRWYVKLRETWGLPEQRLASDAANFRKLTRMFQSQMHRIGAEGVTPDSLDDEIGDEMAKILIRVKR